MDTTTQDLVTRLRGLSDVCHAARVDFDADSGTAHEEGRHAEGERLHAVAERCEAVENLADALSAALAAAPPADLVALGERLRTQDNQMTAHPIFMVQHRDYKHEPWQSVTACLTQHGAEQYLKANGHNLRTFKRVFIESGYRNDEWIGLRNHLMALPAAPPVTDKE